MKTETQALCRAIVIYLGFGECPSPQRDEQKVLAEFGPQMGHQLLEKILKILDETGGMEIDWSKNTLEEAGKLIRSQTQKLHQEFSGAALDAIAWKFTYDWR